jgi:diguanylate cyclase (GGDEF)-like protein
MLQNKNAKFFFTTLFFIFLLLSGIFAINLYTQKKKEYYLQVQSELLTAKYNTSYKYFKIMSHDIFEMYMQNKKLLAQLKKLPHANPQEKDVIRSTIYNLLKKNYRRLTNMGISQIHFHLPNNTSFLRMFAPDKYGDNLTTFRQSIVRANKEKKPQEGFEAGKNLLGIRFVYPIEIDGEFIASVEISFSSQKILQSITDDYIYDVHLLLDKSIAQNTLVGENMGWNYKESWELKNFLIEESTHTKKVVDKNFYNKINTPQLKKEIAKRERTKKAFSVATRYNYKYIVLTFLPLFDVTQQKNIAYIVTYTKSDYLANIEIEHNYIKLLFITILLLIYLFTLYVIINREKLRELALFDTLTKLPNRTLFMIEFQNELNRAQRNKTKIALLFIDLDGFKSVNDTYGHQVGDILLQEVAKKLLSCVRKTDIVSRLSGDEFTVVLTDITDSQEVLKVAQHIITELNKDILIHHKVIHVGASIGVAIYPDNAKDLDTMVKYADSAMYISKNSGKNRVHFHMQDTNTKG